MEELIDLSEDEFLLALALKDELLFLLMFWDDALELEMSVEQKMMACDRSKKVLACTGRKIAKTIFLEAKIVQKAVMHIQKGGGMTEALAFTPRDGQLSPIVDRVFGRISRTPFFSEFFTTMSRGEAPKLVSRTGLTWYFRIEGISGTDQNMVGLRAAHIVGDEMAFGNFVTHNSRVMTALPDADWWYSGVPNGVRNSPFYALDQTSMGSDWSHHKYPTFINPIFPESKRQELVDAYGGETTWGYITQVLGLWGEEMVSTFPPGAIAIGNQPYYNRVITSTVRNDEASISILLGMPSVRANKFAIGWDYGYSPDPSVVSIAYSREPGRWETYARIVMRQVALPIQCRIIRHICTYLLIGNLGAICCDSADAIQTLQDLDPTRAEKYVRTAPGGTMPMTDELGQPIMQKNDKTGNLEVVMIRVKQYLTERFRQFMINANLGLAGTKLILGNDSAMIDELAGTTEVKTQGGYTVYYGPPDPDKPGRMLDHNVDSGRFLADAIMRSLDKEEDSDRELLEAMGWAKTNTEWAAPWSTSEQESEVPS